MKANVEKIENNVVKLEISVDAAKLTDAIKAAYKKNRSRYNVPGFRKGKAPMGILKQYYGTGLFYEEAANILIDESYKEALAENSIRPVDYPQIAVDTLEEGKDFVYTATVTVYPEVKLGEYKGLDIKKPVYEVNDDEVEAKIKEMQEQNARIENKTEGTVEKGNIAVINFKGYIDGEAFDGGEGEDYPLEIGSGTFIDNFEDQLVGAAIGDKKEVNVTFPESYGKEELNGKPAKFDVEIKGIKVKELPALDDEFAKDVSAVETIEELRNNLKDSLVKSNETKAEREFEEAILTELIEKAEMDVPSVMVENEIDTMLKELEQRLKYQNLTLEQYLEFTGNTMDKIRDFMRENAERKVKADLVLEAVAKAEEIAATQDEIKEKALEIAKAYGQKEPEKMAEMLAQVQGPMIENDIVIEKTLKFLKENCK